MGKLFNTKLFTFLYFGLYLLLTFEDYARLMGGGLIFGLLALTLWLTCKLDWRVVGRVVDDEAA